MKNDRNEKLIKKLEKNAQELKKTLETSIDSFEAIQTELFDRRSKMTENEKGFFDTMRKTMSEAFVGGDVSSIDKLKKELEKWQTKNQ